MARYEAITQAAIDHLTKSSCRGASAEKLRALIEAKHPGALDRAKERAKQDRFDAKFTGKVPAWVKTYVRKYGQDVGTVRIRQSRQNVSSTGYCWYGSGDIVVTLSNLNLQSAYGLEEQKVAVLHEIAHTKRQWDRHGDRFHDAWYEMLRAENLYRFAITCGRFGTAAALKRAAKRARANRPLTMAS